MRNFFSRGEDSPLRLVAVILLLVFLAVVLVTAVWISLPPLADAFEEFWSGVALVVLLSPALYFLLVRPLHREITRRRQAQDVLEQRVRERTAELEQARSELEERIQERTGELERVNHDLEHLLEQEQAVRAQLVQNEKFAAIGRMVASVAHELNNPLQTIRNCLYLIGMEDHSPESAEFLRLATDEIGRLTELVAQLREVYRPRAADLMQPCDLVRILDEVRQLMSSHLQRHQVDWEMLAGPGSIMVCANPGELKQVFLNLGLNAMEAMQPQGGRIRVCLESQAETGRVGVVLRDDGPGIDPSDLAHISAKWK